MTPAGGCGLTESLAMCLVSGDGLSSCNEAMAGQGWPRRSPAHFPLPRKVPSTFDALCLGKARLQHPLHLESSHLVLGSCGAWTAQGGGTASDLPKPVTCCRYTRVTVCRKQGNWKVPAPAEAASAGS